jgi:hypothetical protein
MKELFGDSLPPWVPKPEKEVSSKIISTSVLCTSFYFLQILAQKCLGIIGFHGGHSNLLLTPLGCISTVSTLLLSQNVETIIRKNANQWGFGEYLEYKPIPVKQERRDNVKRLILGLGTFIVLEQSLFKTSFPSSVITLGVFGRLGKRFSRSVETHTALTTVPQRLKIQRLGKLYGCHHCGSRQILKIGSTFIADHMPPTKIADAMSKVWWRRWLKRPVRNTTKRRFFSCYIYIRLIDFYLFFRYSKDSGLNVRTVFLSKELQSRTVFTLWLIIMCGRNFISPQESPSC